MARPKLWAFGRKPVRAAKIDEPEKREIIAACEAFIAKVLKPKGDHENVRSFQSEVLWSRKPSRDLGWIFSKSVGHVFFVDPISLCLLREESQ